MTLALRSFIGSACPSCAKDILQAPMPRGRMPPGDWLECLACGAEHTLDGLAGRTKRAGFLRRLFARGQKA